jgi:hypothetical protein
MNIEQAVREYAQREYANSGSTQKMQIMRSPPRGLDMYETSPHDEAQSLLMLRLQWGQKNFKLTPESTLKAHVTQDKVFVFWVVGGAAGHFEDEIALFPSDQLVAQIRLLLP